MRWLAALVLLVAPASAETIVVTSEPCVTHVPDADVAYRPDVDVNGRPLVPVEDTRGRNLRIDPEDVEVTIEVPLREAEVPVDEGGRPSDVDATVEVGAVTIEDGEVLFEGEPLRADDDCLLVDPE
jgi:hypothetical protein